MVWTIMFVSNDIRTIDDVLAACTPKRKVWTVTAWRLLDQDCVNISRAAGNLELDHRAPVSPVDLMVEDHHAEYGN